MPRSGCKNRNGKPRVSDRTLIRIARGLWVFSVLLSPLLLLLLYLNGYPWKLFGAQVFTLVMAQSYPLIGMLIVARQPRNPISWLFPVVFTFFIGALMSEYARYALITRHGALPGGVLAAWVGGWIYRPGFCALLLFLPLLFPTGRLPSPRWRPVAWLALGLMTFFTVVDIFKPDLEDPFNKYGTNPIGVGHKGGMLESVDSFGLPLLFITSFVCLASLFLRFHRARGDERQQLKWLVYAVVVMAICLVTIVFSSGLPNWLDEVGFGLLLAALPVATGIAILKYRLYDIDVIVNRTLVYGALTASLVLVYFVGVVVLQNIFRALTGSESQLAVVVSTLAIAALFQPWRRRVQSFIDRRFYRRKYDAAKTLEAFSTVLREETNLADLNARLLAVVRQTMQPEHVSLWLRESEHKLERR